MLITLPTSIAYKQALKEWAIDTLFAVGLAGFATFIASCFFLISWMMAYRPSLARELRDLPASLSAWSPPVSPHRFRSVLTA